MSCGDTKKKTVKIKSFELNPTNSKDTINVLDSQGRKQGIWLKMNRADNMVSVPDTLFYKDDSLVKK